jgi:transposase
MKFEDEKRALGAPHNQPPNISADKSIPASENSDKNSISALILFLYTFIARLLQSNAELETKVKALTEENSKLAEKANQPVKNSENSSEPPSKDRYRKKSPKLDENGNPIKGKPGAKKGHKAHHRKKYKKNKKKSEEEAAVELPVEDIPTEEVEIKPESTGCPNCGTEMAPRPERDHHKEQYELVPNPVIHKLYTIKAYHCPHCNEIHYGPEPAALATGLIGPLLLTMMAFLRGVGHMSFTGLQRFLTITGVNVCRGFISKCLGKVSDALKKCHDEVKEALPGQPVLNIDETGHKENGKRPWTWVFRAKSFAFFAIRIDRTAGVVQEFLGKLFKGIIGCDYHGAYRKFLKLFPSVKAQFCLCHLKRDIEYLVEHLGSPALREYGAKLKQLLAELFDKNKLWRQLKRERAPDDPDDPDLEGEAREAKAQEVLGEMKGIAQRFKETALDPPNHRLAKNIAKRFLDWPEDFYFTFLTQEGIDVDVEPTNNTAEQTVRFVVQDRHVTQGTRSINGRNRSERLWTVIASCAIQGRSAYDFIKDSILAHFCKDREYPSFFNKDK